jgi:putative peptidoglycan lipid II flippase
LWQIAFSLCFARRYVQISRPVVEKSSVIRSAFKVGSFTLLSRFLGLIRETLTAFAFGTSPAMSDFVVAFRIPNMFRALFGEGALSSAFVPVFMGARKKQGDVEAWLVARKVITLLGAVLLGLVLLGIAACTVLLQFPGLVEHAPMVLPLARIMLPYMLFICLTALSQGILNSFHKFSLPAFTPTLLNITWICFVLFVCPRLGSGLNDRIFGVAWGIFFAGIVQLGAQIPTMWRLGYRPGLSWDAKDERVAKFLTLMGPTALGQSVSQINMLINGVIARWATPWAPAALYFAERLLYFPQGILATAMSTVLLPVFSGHAADGDHAKIRDTLNHALKTLLFVMTPASLGLFVLAEPITQLLLHGGQFRAESVAYTALVVRCYAPGLLVFGLAKVFVPTFYAMHNTRTPYRIGLVSVGLNFGLNILFTIAFPRDLKAASLAVAAVISETFNGIALGYGIHKLIGPPGWRDILRSAARSFGCALAMAAAVWISYRGILGGLEKFGIAAALQHGIAHIPQFQIRTHALAIARKISELVSVFGSIGLGAIVYFATALIFRSPEITNVRDALRRRKKSARETATA